MKFVLSLVALVLASAPVCAQDLEVKPKRPGAPLVFPAITTRTAIAAGDSHSAVIRGGSLWTWGGNGSGQLGSGTTIPSSTPFLVTGIGNTASVSCGLDHTVVLAEDGTVWAFGSNSSGQLGFGYTGGTCAYPYQVRANATTFLGGIVAISAGANHSLAVRNDGTTWAWGANDQGQLGNGTTNSSPFPVQVATGGVVLRSVAGGGAHSLGLTNGGGVMAWGRNNEGQVGDGTTTRRLTPVTLAGLGSVTRIAAGANHSLAFKSDVTQLRVWGCNASYQLGHTVTTDILTPTLPNRIGSAGVVVSGPGASHSFFGDGTVAFGCGNNAFGQLGDGTTTSAPFAWQGSVLGADAACGSNHTVVIDTQGMIWTTGRNHAGQLGDGTTTERHVFERVALGVAAISVGTSHSVAIKNDGTIWSWGGNSRGQLGIGSTSPRSRPVRIGGLPSDILRIDAGREHTLALDAAGRVYAWGANERGQLGLGDTTDRLVPVLIPSLSNITSIAAGDDHSIACDALGRLYTWGGNGRGQIGNGTHGPAPVTAPVQITIAGDPFISRVDAGEYFSTAQNATLGMFAWGASDHGEIAWPPATWQDVLTPVALAFADGVTSFSATGLHTAIVKRDPSATGNPLGVYTAGWNGYGQLGDGTTQNRNWFHTTFPITTPAAEVFTGRSHTICLRPDGTLQVWGSNGYGELGLGDTTERHLPTALPGLTGITGCSAGRAHTIFLKSDGSLWACGGNSWGQLGDGTASTRLTPVRVPEF